MTWTWLLAAASIAGTIANIYRSRWGFGAWAATNAVWALIDLRAGLDAQAALFAVYFALAVWGLAKWK